MLSGFLLLLKVKIMLICHVCGKECEDNTEICPVCGAELINSETGEAIKLNEQDNGIVSEPELVTTINDPIEAEVFCDLLTENNILFTSDQNDLSDSMHMGFGGFYTEIKIYVAKSDLDKATELYKTAVSMLEASIEEQEDFEEEN